MARKFKAHKPEFEHSDFDRLLSEIFPQEVPVKFVSEVKVHYKDGTTKTLNNKELKGIVPKTGIVDAKKIARLWQNTIDVEIYINIELLESIVSLNVKGLLKRF
jgi:hypothetical protein